VARPLWHDEVFTVWASRLAPSELVRVLRFDSGPPLFYLIEKPFVAAAESLALSDATDRLVSFLAIAALFFAARRLPAGARPRFLWLAASSPLLLLYSSEARAYGLLALLGFVLFRLAARDAPQAAGRAAIALVAAILSWTHYLGAVLAGSLLIGCLVVKRRRAAAAIGLGLVLFLPWVPVLLSQPAAAMSWIRDRVGVSAAGFLASLGGSVRVLPPFGRPLPEPVLWLACAAGLGLLVLLLFLRPMDADARLGLSAVLVTLGGIAAVSLWRPAAVAGRSEMAVLPIWLWLAARAGESSRGARRSVAAIAAIGIVSSLLILTSPRASRPLAEVPARLESSARAGDLVVATANFYLPALLARDRGRLGGHLRAFPADLENHPGWFRSEAPSENDYRQLAGEIARTAPGATVFLLLDPPYWTPRLRDALPARGAPARPETLSYGILVVSPAR